MSAYSKSCFLTLGYKGHYIHTYDSDLKAEVVGGRMRQPLVLPRPTWRAAQLAITKHEGAEP